MENFFCDLRISRRVKERLLFTFVGDQVREVRDQGGGKRSRLKGRAEGGDIVWYLCWNIDTFLDPGCFSFTHPIREGLPFLVELTPEGGENRVARLQLSVTEVCIIMFRCLCLPRNDIWNVWCMFGLIFQTQVPNFCLTSRRTGELVLARTRQNLISTLHHRLHCN